MSSVVEIKCIRRRQQLLLSCPPNTTSEPTNIFLLEIAFAYVFHQVYTHTYTDVMRIKDFDNQVVIDEFPEIPKVNTQISWCSCKYQLADILRVLFFSPFCSTACTISWPVRWSTRPTTGVRHHGFGSTPPSPSEAYWHPNWIMWVVRLFANAHIVHVSPNGERSVGIHTNCCRCIIFSAGAIVLLEYHRSLPGVSVDEWQNVDRRSGRYRQCGWQCDAVAPCW